LGNCTAHDRYRVSETPCFNDSLLIIRLTLIERIKRDDVTPQDKQTKMGDQ